MKHHHGINVSLTSATRSSIDEYIDPSFERPRGLKGELNKVHIIATPGEDFRVNLSFEDFRLYSGEGVAVVVACGHGEYPPGGFEHVQYYWIDGDFLEECGPWHFDGYEVWTEKHSSANIELPFTMPVYSAAEGVSDTVRTYQAPFQAKRGSVTVFIQRGTVMNHPEAWFFPTLRAETNQWRVRETAGNNRPQLVHTHRREEWASIRLRVHEYWYAYSVHFVNLRSQSADTLRFLADAASVNPTTLQLRPDNGLVSDIYGNNADDNDSGWDTEDAWSLYDSDEDDPSHTIDDSSDFDSDHELDIIESQDDIEEIRAYYEADEQQEQLLPVIHGRTRLERHYGIGQAPALAGTFDDGRFATPDLQGQDQDDEEALPAKLEGAGAADPATRSPGLDGVPAASIVIARNAEIVSRLSQSQSTEAGALNAASAALQASPAVAVAPTISDLAEVRKSALRPKARAPSPIDLTMDDDDLSVSIKREPSARDGSTAAAGRHEVEIHPDEEDLEDLEDELKEIQARRRLRAARKRKLAEMKSEG
ncbi:hypothetical protein LTS10_010568 [Elasticomyces elasticus]|nr:hypothetical protein LTS10_010568 [Elasticomyces elasticus]